MNSHDLLGLGVGPGHDPFGVGVGLGFGALRPLQLQRGLAVHPFGLVLQIPGLVDGPLAIGHESLAHLFRGLEDLVGHFLARLLGMAAAGSRRAQLIIERGIRSSDLLPERVPGSGRVHVLPLIVDFVRVHLRALLFAGLSWV